MVLCRWFCLNVWISVWCLFCKCFPTLPHNMLHMEAYRSSIECMTFDKIQSYNASTVPSTLKSFQSRGSHDDSPLWQSPRHCTARSDTSEMRLFSSPVFSSLHPCRPHFQSHLLGSEQSQKVEALTVLSLHRTNIILHIVEFYSIMNNKLTKHLNY